VRHHRIAALKLTVDAVLTGRVEVKLQQLVNLAWQKGSAQVSTSEVEMRMLTAVFEIGNSVEVLNLHSVAVVKDVGGGRAVGNCPFKWGLLALFSFFGFDVDRHLEAWMGQGGSGE
jgi:hypothetical protein